MDYTKKRILAHLELTQTGHELRKEFGFTQKGFDKLIPYLVEIYDLGFYDGEEYDSQT